jgi:WD40 repeat protein
VIATATELVTRRLDTGAVVHRVPLAEPLEIDLPAPVVQLYASPDGRRALAWHMSGRPRAVIQDLASGARPWVSETNVALSNPGSLLPSTDLSRVLAISYPRDRESTLRVIDTTTGRVLRTLSGPAVFDASLSADGTLCAVRWFAASAPIVIWNEAGAQIALDTPDEATQVRFARSGHRVLVSGRGFGRIVDADTRRTIADLRGVTDTLEDGRFSADGRLIATWSLGRSAVLWDADSGALRMVVNGVARGGFAISSDGRRFATVGDDGAIRIWDIATARLLEVLHGDGPAAGDLDLNAGELQWSADGTRLIAGSMHTPSVSIWDVHLEHRTPAEISALVPPSLVAKLVDPLLATDR